MLRIAALHFVPLAMTNKSANAMESAIEAPYKMATDARILKYPQLIGHPENRDGDGLQPTLKLIIILVLHHARVFL